MTKEEVVAMMLDSINSDNREICVRAGMNVEEAEMQIQQSQQSLSFMLSNVYDKLKESNIIN